MLTCTRSFRTNLGTPTIPGNDHFVSMHYENMPIQYTDFVFVVKKKKSKISLEFFINLTHALCITQLVMNCLILGYFVSKLFRLYALAIPYLFWYDVYIWFKQYLFV